MPRLEDDHVPFQKRKVPILHVIPIPFPKTWHTKADNLENIDKPTTMALLLLFRAFLFEYFSLAA